MKFEMTLNEKDYLDQSLFFASKSKVIRNRRIRTFIILFVVFALMSLYYPGWYMPVLGLTFIILYALYQPHSYRRLYHKSVVETYKNRFGKPMQVEFQDNQLLIKTDRGESISDLSQLEHIYETGAYFFLKFKTAEVLAIPKYQLPQPEAFRDLINQLVQKYRIQSSQELNWKFR